MVSISIKDMLLYCSCPLKYKLEKENERGALTRSDLYSIAAKAATISFFNHLSNNHKTPTAAQRAVRKFDEVWLDNYSRLIPERRDQMYTANLLMTYIGKLYDPMKDEVVGTNFPIIRTYSGNLILKDSVDVLLINRANGSYGKTTYRGIQIVDPLKNDNNRYIQFRLALFKSAIQEYLGPTKRYFQYELRPIAGVPKIIDPKPIFYTDLIRLASNVSKGIRNQIWYPTTSKETCKECPLNRTCKMSLLR